MNYFVSFVTYHQSMYFMSTNGFRVPHFQLAYIYDTTYPSHTKLFKLCREVHYMWWGFRASGVGGLNKVK